MGRLFALDKMAEGPFPEHYEPSPGSGVGPMIMPQEGMGRLLALAKRAAGQFPEHYEPFETPLGTNPLHPTGISNPAARIFKDAAEALGKADKFPYVGTTYRLTENFNYWTKHALLKAILKPEQFVEIGDSYAESERQRYRYHRYSDSLGL